MLSDLVRETVFQVLKHGLRVQLLTCPVVYCDFLLWCTFVFIECKQLFELLGGHVFVDAIPVRVVQDRVTEQPDFRGV